MADNHLLFSEVTPQLSRAEYDWFQNQLQKIFVVQGKERTDVKGIDRKQIEWAGFRAFRDVDDYDPDFSDTTVGFDYECSDKDEDRSLWFYSHDWGSVDRIAHLMQRFLKKFRPRETWSLTYATTCSRPRIGEFGGGAVFVTARWITWHDAHSLIERHVQSRERRNGRKRVVLT